ncbi:hypothetical protein G210_0857, partial [Candida maltosa Xu316]
SNSHLTSKNKSYKPLVKRTNLTSKKEINLDKQIKYWKIRRDTLTKTVKYVQEQQKIEFLIEKYKNIAQMASNYVFNEYCTKFAKMGGYKVWQHQQWESKKRSTFNDDELESTYTAYLESEEFAQLSEFEKKEIQLQFEMYLDNEEKETAPPEFEDEFTMKELYKILKLNYQLVYET